jgi:sugar/nucleoside kinase (ribokinase family)
MSAAPRFDIVTFGENSLDTLVQGTALRAEDVARVDPTDLPGGQAATVAVGCRRLGWRARYIGAFGDDEPGRIVRETLAAEHVDVMAIVRARVPSRRALVTIDPASGDRHVISYRDDRLNIAMDELDDDQFLGTRLLMVDATDLDGATRLAARARRAGVTTLVDADHARPGVRELLNYIDLIVLPGEIVPALSGVPSIGAGLRALGKETGAQAVIATLGSEGALGWSAGGEHRVTGSPEDVTDTVGAGDGFRAGVAAAWLGANTTPGVISQGNYARRSIRPLLDAGTLVAGLNCRARGAQAGLPRKSEVPEALRGPL